MKRVLPKAIADQRAALYDRQHWLLRLGEARASAGLSLAALERATGVQAFKWQKAERTGCLVMDARDLLAVADVLGVSIDWLVGRDLRESRSGHVDPLAELTKFWRELCCSDRELVLDFARTLVST